MTKKLYNPEYKEAFFIVPRYISELPGITLAYLKIYDSMFQFWNKGLNCYLSTETLIDRTGYKRSQVFKALIFFEKHGELKRIQIGLKRYLVKPESKIEIISKKLIQESTETDSCTDIIQESDLVDSPVRFSGLDQSTKSDHNIKKGNVKKEPYIYRNFDENFNNSKTPTPVHSSTVLSREPQEPPKPLTPVDYPDTYFNPVPPDAPPSTKSLSKLNLGDLVGDNPHNLPEQMLEDYLLVRDDKNSPLSRTAWHLINRELCKVKNSHDTFELMIANGWLSLNAKKVNDFDKPKLEKGQFDHTSTDWIYEDWGI